MTTSDDNDKTQLKPFDKKAGGIQDNSGDKTQILRPTGPRKNTGNGNKAESKTPSERAAIDEKRRIAAQKKARELEKRLASIAAKKSAAALKERQLESANADKTRMNVRQEPQAEPSSTEGSATSAADSLAARAQSPGSSDLPPLTAQPDDRTRISNAVSRAKHDSSDDKTQFSPMRADSDKTQFKSISDVDETRFLEDELASTEFIDHDIVSQPISTGHIAIDPEKYVGEGEELLKNRFVFDSILGAGGMGVVYKAKDLLKVEAHDKDPYVAIKVLSDEFKSHPEAFIALQRESRKTQRIAHPNIVNVHDFDRDGDTVFMTMEFLEGKPLDKLISQYKSTGLPEEDAWHILKGISAALVHAHNEQIIHSDFKPGNIFVTGKGTAKVFDFGIARAVAKAEKFEESVDDKTVFDAGNLGALTPAYASLEMLEGMSPDVRDDIYALGCIAYEMFTGNHPFNRVHANEAMRQKMKPKRIANVSKRQWKVIERALAFKREDRIETVADFWQQLTTKRSSALLFVAVATVVVMSLGSLLVYQNYFAPKDQSISEDDMRSEIEQKLLIRQNKKDLADLLGSLRFTERWEAEIFTAVKALRQLLGDDDVWLLGEETKVFAAYLEKINALIGEENFDQALLLHGNAARYAGEDTTSLGALLALVEEGKDTVAKREQAKKEEEDKAVKSRQQQASKAKVKKERNAAFDTALATVNKQLQCRSTMNIRDIDIAVSKLRTLNASRYRKAEKDVIVRLSACIKKIGRSFPERAEEFKKRAQRIFPKSSMVANIKIEPKDPCDTALAGLGARGARATCRDTLKRDGDDFGKGPAMVVIPAKGSVSAFAVGKYEVTVDDVNKFCAVSDTCKEISASGKMPATQLSSTQIDAYLSWLSKQSKRQYRLPTKAEWIYAARANSSKLDSNRNCRLDSRGIKKGGFVIKATTGQQNSWGLVNYLGNARELVSDGEGFAALGGSYETDMRECIVTKSERHQGKPDKLTGFRVLREIDNAR